MTNKPFPYIACALACLLPCIEMLAQQVTPVFEHLFTESDPALPILKVQESLVPDDNRYDTTSTIDSYGGFRRYDEARLMLGIRENGIDESDPGHDAALAAAYPDRSIQWVDAGTGDPMGTAIEVGIHPVPLEADFTGAGGTELDYYFTFGVSDDDVVFVGYKHKILRYAPDGQGGFEGPEVAYTHEEDGSDRWHQWRWENIRVQGAAEGTIIMAGGKTWRPNQGYHVLGTTDGKTFSKFEDEQDIKAGGGASTPIAGRVPEDPEGDWVYASLYPGASNGVDTRYVRRVGDLESFFPFENDGTFRPKRDEQADPETEYVTEFISDVDGDSALGYVVTYSTPSWNSKVVKRLPTRPGFLGLHTHDGDVIGSYTLDVREDQEIVGDPEADNAASIFYGTLGGVEVNVLEGMRAGQSEILWYSGIYGYGRYLVGVGGASPQSTVLMIQASADGVEILWEGKGVLESSADVTGPWMPVAGATSPHVTPAEGMARFYRVVAP
ncbi:MAG: hypothetical protein P8L18_12300 [Verrucomicrobiota bacterium]|nr:hypothetical protein [Verrucomicrobiota bacterium]